MDGSNWIQLVQPPRLDDVHLALQLLGRGVERRRHLLTGLAPLLTLVILSQKSKQQSIVSQYPCIHVINLPAPPGVEGTALPSCSARTTARRT
jgi:hypothetical protein